MSHHFIILDLLLFNDVIIIKQQKLQPSQNKLNFFIFFNLLTEELEELK